MQRSKTVTLLKDYLKCVLAGGLAAMTLSANAATYDGAMVRTKYVLWTGDVNLDGMNDVLMKAVPGLVTVPLDDDLIIPISIAPPSPTFALISNQYGNYSLVTAPDFATVSSTAWKEGTQRVAFYGASSSQSGSVSIIGSSPDQASFVIAMSASGKLYVADVILPEPTCS